MDATTSRSKWKKHNKSGRYFRTQKNTNVVDVGQGERRTND